VETSYIEPGNSWKGGYTESFNGRFCDELPDREEFENLPDARAYGTRYRLAHNYRRPHSASMQLLKRILQADGGPVIKDAGAAIDAKCLYVDVLRKLGAVTIRFRDLGGR
jgi:hypothetical protein